MNGTRGAQISYLKSLDGASYCERNDSLKATVTRDKDYGGVIRDLLIR